MRNKSRRQRPKTRDSESKRYTGGTNKGDGGKKEELQKLTNSLERPTKEEEAKKEEIQSLKDSLKEQKTVLWAFGFFVVLLLLLPLHIHQTKDDQNKVKESLRTMLSLIVISPEKEKVDTTIGKFYKKTSTVTLRQY